MKINNPSAIKAVLRLFASQNKVKPESEQYSEINLAGRRLYRRQAQLRLIIRELEREYHRLVDSNDSHNEIIIILIQLSEKYLELSDLLTEENKKSSLSVMENFEQSKLPQERTIELNDKIISQLAKQFESLAKDYSFVHLGESQKSSEYLFSSIENLKKLAYKSGFNTVKRIHYYLEIASKYYLLAIHYREHKKQYLAAVNQI